MLLEGIRVIEMGFWVAGPAAAGLLCDWGADVVKIEPPTGDPYRRIFQALAGIDIGSPPFNLDNRGKRSVVLDLSKDEGREAALDLIGGADVFLTNYRHGALERLGLDSATLRARFPELVYAHVTGYGQEGPDRDRAGYDMGSFWARGGIAHLLAQQGAEPVASRGGFGDHITATHCAAGVLAALLARHRTGEGQLVDASLLRSGIYTIGFDVMQQLELGFTLSAGKREESIVPTVSSFQAGDGRWVWLLGVEADRHWPRLCEGLELGELLSDPRFANAAARRENAREMMRLLDERFATRPLDEWLERFDAVDLWWAPVQTPADVVEDPQARAAGAFVDVPQPDGTTKQAVGSPIRFGDAEVAPRAGVPAVGEHTDDVLREAGFDAERIAKLASAGVTVAAGSGER
ncbi:MAG: CoA transferase [Myxococcota bacterium]|nr:CoA transferase [Myxococcota bacterium]